MKKITLGLMTGLITTCTIAGMLLLNNNSPTPSINNTKASYVQKLEQEKIQLWQEIKNAFGVDLGSFHQENINEWHKKPSNPVQATDATEILIFEIAQEFGYNTDLLKVQCEPLDIPSAAAACRGVLFINTNVFPFIPEKQQRFIIAHELAHLVNNDGQEKKLIRQSCNNQKFIHEQELLFNKYQRFQEKRADILAALQGNDWANLYVEYAEHGLTRNLMDNGITHPTFKERLKLAQNIVNEINVQIT